MVAQCLGILWSVLTLLIQFFSSFTMCTLKETFCGNFGAYSQLCNISSIRGSWALKCATDSE